MPSHNYNAKLIRRMTDEEGNIEVTFLVKGYANKLAVSELKKDLDYRIQLAEISSKRSNEQNKLLWLLLHEISEKLHQSDEDTYINALELAEAKFEYVACLPEAEHILTNNYRAVKLMNSFEHNGRTFNQYRVYDGSSKMNTKEMGKLLDTVIQMAVELDIPVDEGRYL